MSKRAARRIDSTAGFFVPVPPIQQTSCPTRYSTLILLAAGKQCPRHHRHESVSARGRGRPPPTTDSTARDRHPARAPRRATVVRVATGMTAADAAGATAGAGAAATAAAGATAAGAATAGAQAVAVTAEAGAVVAEAVKDLWPRAQRQIVVERLTKTINDDHLYEIFGKFGRIKDLDLPINRTFGTNRGTAYILYDHEADAEAAIANMHEAQVDGATIHVSIVLPRRKLSPPPPTARRGANIDPRVPFNGGRRGGGGGGGGGRRRRGGPPTSPSGGSGRYGPRSDVYRPGGGGSARSQSPPPGRGGSRYRSRSPASYSSRSRSPPPRKGSGAAGGHGRRSRSIDGRDDGSRGGY
ncbi:hypothetical protein PWT90_01482 [Aphanocladium album]|nr:hypothetical protein PWT90_01482 [Aphanocladium album]